MADNVTLPANTGTFDASSDDCGASGQVQRVKLSYSADGVATHVQADADGVLVNLGSNNDVTVTSLPAIPAGTNNIGDVDVLSVVPGTGASALGKAEDAAHADGDTGVLILGVRNHSGTGSDGDYSAMCVSSTGELCVIARRDLVRIAVDTTSLTTSVTAYTAGDTVGTELTIANAARSSGGGGTIIGVVLTSAADIIGAYDVVFTRQSITLAADNAAYAISDADAKHVIGMAQLSGAFDIGNNRIAQAFGIAIPYSCNATSLFASLITRAGHTFFGANADLQLQVFVERN